MAEILPLAGYRYDQAKVRLEQALTQPYDKITPQMQERYYAASPFNLVAVEKGKSFPADTPQENVYSRAAAKLREWVAAGVLVRESAPSVYVYFQEFQVPGSSEVRTRRGFIALGRVHDYSDGVVFRHEQTLAGPKADRLELLRRTRTLTGQLFMLYSDPARGVDALLDSAAGAAAPVEVRDEYGVVHRVWPVSDARFIERLRGEMADKKLVIADGHHRYETALAYRNECRAAQSAGRPGAPHEWTMMTFVNTHAEGLVILPTHRVVAGLAGFDLAVFRRSLEPSFDWHSYPFSSTAERATAFHAFRADLLQHGREGRALGAYAGDGAFHVLRLRNSAELETLLPGVSPGQRQLDVILLHQFILEQHLGITPDAVVRERNITYEREMERAIAAVDSRDAQLCFLLNSVRVEQVAEIALGGEVMPQKSTDFYPKMLSGLTLYRLDG